MAKKVVVEESTQYDNFVGKTDTDNLPNKEDSDLSSFFDGEIVDPKDADVDSWKKHWTGMPEFVQDEKSPYKTLYLHFRNEDDYNAFAKLINQNLSKKTKSIWYPKLEREDNYLFRWMEE